uniref:RING-type domain-containing protein n=1 Tax=Glossina palpalis gambiensis TaxID=67801 RepID=A0A1B0B6E9_9MUSC
MLNLNCAICTELFSPSDEVYVTTCGHMFHFTCLGQWLERSKTCPQCRNKCPEHSIIRVYFNLANLDTSRIDIGSLQEQLDNAKLQIKMKETELKSANDQIKSLKDIKKKCMKTITGFDLKLQNKDFVISSYAEQLKMLKSRVKAMEDASKENKALKNQIETMEGINTLLTASSVEAEKLLNSNNDIKTLATWVATLKRELRVCEHKKTDMRNLLKVVQTDLHKQTETKKNHEERISQLESENYQLKEKVKTLENPVVNNINGVKDISIGLNTAMLPSPSPCHKEEEKCSIVVNVEDQHSPYLKIKASSVGLMPLLKHAGEGATKVTTTKLGNLKISPVKRTNKSECHSELSEKYSIFKKPRIGVIAAAANGASIIQTKDSNFVSNGFGGSERINPFEQSVNGIIIEEVTKEDANIPSTTGSNVNKRLKTRCLRNFKVTK